MLNTGKGSSRSIALRAQADKTLLTRLIKTVENQRDLMTLRQTMIDEILVEDGKGCRCSYSTHQKYAAKAIIVTTGTALREIIIGDLKYSSGPNHGLATITWLTISRDLASENRLFQDRNTSTCQGFFYQLWCDRNPARDETQITFLILHVMRIM